jgi:histone H3
MVKTKVVPRFRPGAIVQREITRYQEVTKRIIPPYMFRRAVRDIVDDIKKDFSIDPAAMEALQWAAEDYATKVFDIASQEAMKEHRVTILPVDLHMAVAIEQEQLEEGQLEFKATRKQVEHEYRDTYYSMPKVEGWEWK